MTHFNINYVNNPKKKSKDTFNTFCPSFFYHPSILPTLITLLPLLLQYCPIYCILVMVHKQPHQILPHLFHRFLRHNKRSYSQDPINIEMCHTIISFAATPNLHFCFCRVQMLSILYVTDHMYPTIITIHIEMLNLKIFILLKVSSVHVNNAHYISNPHNIYLK